MKEGRPSVLIDSLGMTPGKQRGAERFWHRLVEVLVRLDSLDITVVCNRAGRLFFERLLPPGRVITLPISGANRVLRMLLQTVLLPLLSVVTRARVLLSASVFPLIYFPCPTLLIVHDVLPFHPFPGTYGRFERLARKWLLRTCLRGATAIITVSDWVATDMRRKLADSLRGRIYVVPNAADDLRRLGDMIGAKPEALPTGLPHNGKIILSVLGGSRYKNQVRLVEAFQRWGRKDTALVVIGDAAQLLSGMDCGPRVSILGYVSDLELVRWYKAAALFVFPSLFEGFGIPVIEAQNFGLPVVCSDLPVLREVSGGAALFVDPYSVVSLSEAMERMLSDEALRGRLIEAGYENASRYSWAHSAEILLNALRREMGGASLEL